MTIDRPAQWAIDKYDVERGLWALDTARGVWVKVYSNPDFARRPEDFIFCGYVEAARIFAGGLVPVDNHLVVVDSMAGQMERRVS